MSNSFEITEATKKESEFKNELDLFAEMQLEHNQTQIQKIVSDPSYRPNFQNNVIKSGVVAILEKAITYRKSLINEAPSASASCAHAIDKYKTTSLIRLENAYAKYKDDLTTETDVLPVILMANYQDSIHFLSNPVAACGK